MAKPVASRATAIAPPRPTSQPPPPEAVGLVPVFGRITIPTSAVGSTAGISIGTVTSGVTGGGGTIGVSMDGGTVAVGSPGSAVAVTVGSTVGPTVGSTVGATVG